MEKSINKRISEIIEEKKINEPDFYKKLGTPRQTWNGWINAEAPIPLKKIQLIIGLLPDVDARWLLTGVGRMLNDEEISLQNEAQEPMQSYKNCERCEEKENRIKELKDHIESLKKMLDSQLTVSVKNDTAHCG